MTFFFFESELIFALKLTFRIDFQFFITNLQYSWVVVTLDAQPVHLTCFWCSPERLGRTLHFSFWCPPDLIVLLHYAPLLLTDCFLYALLPMGVRHPREHMLIQFYSFYLPLSLIVTHLFSSLFHSFPSLSLRVPETWWCSFE